MGEEEMPSRWDSAPSALDRRQVGLSSQGAARPVDLVAPFPGRARVASRFDPVQQAPPPAGVASSLPSYDANQTNEPSSPQTKEARIGASSASVDLIRNQG